MAKVGAASYHNDLALLTQCPAPGAVESIAYLTDVMTADDSTEDRVALRTKPRISWSYKIPLRAWQEAEALNTLYGGIRSDWALPIWADSQTVGNVSGVTIDCDTTLYDLRSASTAMLVSGDDYQLVEIQTVDSNGVTLYSAADPMSDAILIPVRQATLRGNAVKSGTSKTSEVDLTFDINVDDVVALHAEAPSQYSGSDVYTDEPKMPGSTTTFTLSQREDVTDFDLGPISKRTTWSTPRYARAWRYVLRTRAEIHDYRTWLQRRQGRYRAFYAATYEANFRVKGSGLITTALSFESDSFVDWAAGRSHLVIEDVNGQYYLKGISGAAQVDSTTAQVTLDSALNLLVGNVKRVSWLGLCRLDTDMVEITWLGGGLAESVLPVLEIAP